MPGTMQQGDAARPADPQRLAVPGELADEVVADVAVAATSG